MHAAAADCKSLRLDLLKTMPKKVAVLESERSSWPILSLTLASILFLRKRTACDLLVDILKPLAIKNLAISFSCFYMRDIISPSFVPVVQRAISSAYIDGWTLFIGLAIPIIMIMKISGLKTLT